MKADSKAFYESKTRAVKIHTIILSFSELIWLLKRLAFGFVVAVLLGSGEFAMADTQGKRKELEHLKGRIHDLEETLGRARGHKQQLTGELETIERQVGDLARQLRRLEADITDRSQALQTLQEEERTRRARIDRQQHILRGQLRSAFVMGRQERLRILLSQEDPGLITRMMAYHEYLSRARARRIGEIREQVEQLRGVEAAIREEKARLQVLHEARSRERKDLEDARSRHRKLVQRLDHELRDSDAELVKLKRDAQAMQLLVKRLETELAKTESVHREPMYKRRGRLSWPVSGRISVRFGSSRASGGLTWDGVVIDAAEGGEVRAIHHGRVAYADWLRGFGLLLILDHGDGYMSLYGFNQTLLKETGEWVEEGEGIALVGASGGRSNSGLYFGIRRNAQPRNPRKWCRRLKGRRTG